LNSLSNGVRCQLVVFRLKGVEDVARHLTTVKGWWQSRFGFQTWGPAYRNLGDSPARWSTQQVTDLWFLPQGR